MHRYPASMRVKCVNRMRWDAVQHGENYAAIVMHTLRSIFPSDVIILSYPIQNCFTFSILVRAIPDETPCDRSIHALTTNIERTRARLLTTMTRTFSYTRYLDRSHTQFNATFFRTCFIIIHITLYSASIYSRIHPPIDSSIQHAYTVSRHHRFIVAFIVCFFRLQGRFCLCFPSDIDRTSERWNIRILFWLFTHPHSTFCC